MRVRPLALGALAGVALLVPAGASAATPKTPATTTVKARGGLTSETMLVGTVSFTTPKGWTAKNDAARHTTAAFRVDGPGACQARVWVSVRAVATSRNAEQQVGTATPLGHGTRPGGAWGILGPTIAGGEGEPLRTGLLGTAPVRVQANRWGQIRVESDVVGCDRESAEATGMVAKDATLVRQAAHVLAKARTRLRVVRVDRD
ncbi:hypothetical protein [Patulibacter sp. SYSU D01012]|uniref:hypothetical protein n=1 Tax=Patulibacter sp. SYSU D01012 TaxID=2817381 RepID=UPI001B314C8F|nr:hypothetical protein [Patulibacter sp. SYSU D01012]